jgi:hypothetical protein
MAVKGRCHSHVGLSLFSPSKIDTHRFLYTAVLVEPLYLHRMLPFNEGQFSHKFSDFGGRGHPQLTFPVVARAEDGVHI